MWLCLSDDLQPLDPRSHLLPRESPRMNSLTLQWRIWVTILNIFLVFFVLFSTLFHFTTCGGGFCLNCVASSLACDDDRMQMYTSNFIHHRGNHSSYYYSPWLKSYNYSFVSCSSPGPPPITPPPLVWLAGWLGVMSLPQQYLWVCVPFDFSSVASVTWLLLLLLLPNNIIRFL